MGIFDIFSPFFSWVDLLLQDVLPPMGRLVFWGLVGSALPMWLYAVLSSQKKLSQLKTEVAKTRKALADYDGDFAGAWQLIRQSLKLSFKQIGLALGPTIIASLPVLFLLVWLSTAYNYSLPEAGTIIDIKIVPTSAQVQWLPQPQSEQKEGKWQISWPTSEESLLLHNSTSKQLLVSFPLSEPVPIVHKRQWWNILFGNPVGYLPNESNVESVEIALPENKYLQFGPTWMHSAEVFFLLIVIIGSLAIKIIFRIH